MTRKLRIGRDLVGTATTGWHCTVDLFDVDGTGLRALRLESGVSCYACSALAQAMDRAEEHLSEAMGELRNE